MNINSISYCNINWGSYTSHRKNFLRTQYLRGNMPSVKHGIYGGVLTSENVTTEHILPKSKGGGSELSNLALAVNTNNWSRSDRPLYKVFNKEAFDQYCNEISQVKLPDFNGLWYVRNLIKTVNKVLKEGL